MNDILELVTKGGWLMAPILVCSLFGLTFFLERLWKLQRHKILPAKFLDVIARLLKEGRFAEAETLCHSNESPISAVLGSGIRYAGQSRELIKEVMEETGQREVFFMERFTNALGSIATIAPLLGLLGTVIGMIQMFQRVVGAAGSGKASVDVSLLATGIWQALTTTAAGLAVAIPIFLAYRYILSRIDSYAIEIEEISLRAVEVLVPASEAPTSLAPMSTKDVSSEGAKSEESTEDQEDDEQEAS